MMIMPETFLKAMILTHGVQFTDEALLYARKTNAKIQNLVYNAPLGADNFRPQELLIRHSDGFETVSSCVAPGKLKPVVVDCKNGELFATVDNRKVEDISISFIEEPDYYSYKLEEDLVAKDFVSACGLDELNIIPWKGCNISAGCLFCGANTVAGENKASIFTAYQVSSPNFWNENKDTYLNYLTKSVKAAIKSKCYDEHMHVILISGDLSDQVLDMQAHIYCDIVRAIKPLVEKKSTEGIIAVCMPPNDLDILEDFKEAGIKKIVFNFELGNEDDFAKYCPGKKNIGFNHILDALKKGVDVFGYGNSWTNFVLGLEPIGNLLKFNQYLASQGIVSSANVLHLDKGNRLDCDVPSFETVINYFYSLDKILKEYNLDPFYCSKALRTSLSNEARFNRIVL